MRFTALFLRASSVFAAAVALPSCSWRMRMRMRR